MAVTEVDVLVIGAGVIGLACARAFAMAGREVVLLERENQIATQTSSRNSEVIHAGLYYPTGSLKARSCVEGRRRLYRYLDTPNLAHRKCRKLIVATNEDEAAKLKALRDRAAQNQVEGIELIDGATARALEPALSDRVVAAILSKETGIFDSHAFYLSLLSDFETAGGTLVLKADVLSGEADADAVTVNVGGPQPYEIRAERVINAAGLQAIDLAHAIRAELERSIPKSYFAKGHYFSISGSTPFEHLIYPMPNTGGLGTHLTLDLTGRGRLGPDVEWIERPPDGAFDYATPDHLKGRFLGAVRQFWPDISEDRLHPSYSGIRPKLVGPGTPPGDFMMVSDRTGRLTHLFGIESPGLTASLSLARFVVDGVY